MDAGEDRPAAGWVRIALGYLAASDLFVGLWAVLAPESWFRSFPGLGMAWVAAQPPYNEHLTIDAGAGFLGIGVVLLLAAVWGTRRVAVLAAAGALAHGVPHAVFHVVQRPDAMSTTDAMASAGSLVFGCVVAGAVVVSALRTASRVDGM